MNRLFQSLAALSHIAVGGSLTGLGTGAFWSIVVGLFSLEPAFQRNRTAPFTRGARDNGSDSLEDPKDPYLDCAGHCISDATDPTVRNRFWGCQYAADDNWRRHWAASSGACQSSCIILHVEFSVDTMQNLCAAPGKLAQHLMTRTSNL